MADKGFLGGSMQFGVGDEDSPKEVVEGPLLPLRALIVTALVPTEQAQGGANAPTRPTSLDLSDPASIFNVIRPRVILEVPSVLSGGGVTKVEFAPTSMKSFRPDGMITEVPIVRDLMEGKRVLDRLRSAEIDEEQAEKQLLRLWKNSPLVSDVLGRQVAGVARAATEPSSAPVAAPAAAASEKVAAASSGSLLDDLLDKVDLSNLGEASSPREAAGPEALASDEGARVSRLIANFALGGTAKAGRGKSGIPRCEEAIGAQIGAILQHPEVRRLERAYRAISLIAERSTRVSGVRIDVLDATPETAAEALRGALGRGAEVPYTLALVDVEIDGTARSFTLLEALAEIAEEHVCPVVVNAVPHLLGVGDIGRIDRQDSKMNLFTAPHRAPWRSTAAKPSLRWVCLAMNGLFARRGYDAQSSRVREANLVELPSDHEAWVFIPAAYAVLMLVIKSFKETGFPRRITGPRHGVLENLTVFEIDDDGQPVAIPTEGFLSTESQRELSRIGLCAVACQPNSDAAYLHVAPTAYVPPDKKTYGEEPRAPSVSLVDQLLVGRTVQFVRSLARKLPREVDPREACAIMQAALDAFFESAPQVGRKVMPTDDPEGGAIVVLLRPNRFLGVSLDELSFEMPLG